MGVRVDGAMAAGPRRWFLATLLLIQVVFQFALAAGAPWGRAAWGGQNEGVLPLGFRVASGIAAGVWLWILLVVLERFLGKVGRRRTLLVLAAYTALGVVANAASPSPLERAIWTPYCVALAGAAWLAARREREAAPS